MKDFVDVCCSISYDANKVDPVLIGLSYRLNKLDNDWKDYIPKKSVSYNLLVTLYLPKPLKEKSVFQLHKF